MEWRATAEAIRCGITVNCAVWPELGTFHVPAQVRHGDLQIAISSGRASPALVRKLAQQLCRQSGPEYARWTVFLLELRPVVLNSVHADRRSKAFEERASDQFLRLFRDGETKLAATLAKRIIEMHIRKQVGPSTHKITKKDLKRTD